MRVTRDTTKGHLKAHLQQWFAEPVPSISGTSATRLESVNLMQIARLSGLNQGNLRLFALGQRGLSLRSLTNLTTVVKSLGFGDEMSEPKT